MTGAGSSCGACKFLRRRCTSDCLFAPYFRYEQAPSHFAAVHKVFGASNVSKLLLHLPVHSRSDAAETISYEALARMQDPVYGCVAHIFALQQQVAILKEEIEIIGSQMANLGVGIASCAVSHETSNPYTIAPSSIGCDVSSHCSNQQSLCILHSGDTSVNQACCSHIELQHPGIEHETSKLCFDSSILERLLQDLSQDYYVHSPWMKNAAP